MPYEHLSQHIQIENFTKTISDERFSPYLKSTNSDRELAFQLYIWNCDLASAFSLPLHVAEITIRNSILKTLRIRLNKPWYYDSRFNIILDQRYKLQIRDTIDRHSQNNGSAITDNQIISDLSFGFWEHLMTSRFERLLWHRGIKHPFPFAYQQCMSYRDMHDKIQPVVQWRNRIAHLKRIYHKDPMRHYEDIIQLIRFVSPEMSEFVENKSDFRAVYDRRHDFGSRLLNQV